MDTKNFEDAFVRLVEQDTEAALQLITGMFVGLTLEYMRRRGHEPNGDIKIEGGSSRDITIHAQKMTDEDRRALRDAWKAEGLLTRPFM
ncbi:MAG: hypothetical protein J0M20_18050 [Burkholderiales bacterium]|nr:hypothetical protein [Burkholderiales bacterium]